MKIHDKMREALEEKVQNLTGAESVYVSNGVFHCLMSVNCCGEVEELSIPWYEAISSILISWFKEPEVYAMNFTRETTYGNVFNTLTQEESVMALREYGRLCMENKWLSRIEPEMMHNYLSLVNRHLASKRKAEKYLAELCGKYNFDYDLFMDIIDEEYMVVFEK